MKKRLITWEQFENKFKPYSTSWCKYSNGIDEYDLIYNGLHWFINSIMFKYFGTEIEVKKIYNDKNYTYKDCIAGSNYWYHESWFEPEFIPIDFITEKEIEL